MKYLYAILLMVFSNKIDEGPKQYRLLAKPTLITSCGAIIITAQQFLFIDMKDSSQIIGIIRCPDGLGESFFKEDSIYNIVFDKDSILGDQYNLKGYYENPGKKIPERIIETITKNISK
jgi:hypothetical protein